MKGRETMTTPIRDPFRIVAVDRLIELTHENWDRARPRLRYAEHDAICVELGPKILDAAAAVVHLYAGFNGPWHDTREAAAVSYARLVYLGGQEHLWPCSPGQERPEGFARLVAWETILIDPERAEAHGIGSGWWVCWESNPWHDQGIYLGYTKDVVSEGDLVGGGSFYTEPYWGFDVLYVED